jgi:hypothetical protein
MSDMLTVYFPGKWWSPVVKAILLYANPWFVFDILQIYNPKFAKEGYKIPFWGKKTSSNLEAGNPPTRSDIGWVTKESGGKKSISYGSMGVVGFGACIALLLPALYTMSASFPASIQSKIVPVLNSIFSVGGMITALAGGGLGTLVIFPQLISSVQGNLTQVMTGGNRTDIPSLESVADSLLMKPADKEESRIFLGVLTIAAICGGVIALVRAKDFSPESV